jgi:hypothetical protein
MRYYGTQAIAASLTVPALLACSQRPATEEVLFSNPVSDLASVVMTSAVTFDAQTTSDGTGSLKIGTADSITVQLYEVGDIDLDNSRLVYRAQLRTEGVEGYVFLEMWCRFPGVGAFFSRALHAPLTGSTEWTSQETPFFLEEGQNPDHVALSVVVTGAGTVWVDEVALVKLPR